jgi:UDP-N-acetylmuramoylalanine--D-glutamate ligase
LEFKEKKIGILGCQKSGKALARILTREGAEVLISDRKEADALADAMAELSPLGVRFETGGHSDAVYRGKDMVVISPGVSVNHPILKEAREAGVPVLGEIEIAYRLCSAPIIAVTGTNGKSTTVSLIHQAIGHSGGTSLLAGNIGMPLVAEVHENRGVQWVVVEVSSFQLETIARFRPRIGVILNITVDHMDRHSTMGDYAGTKARLFSNQGDDDYAVLNADDENIVSMAGGIAARKYYFSRRGPVLRGTYLDDDRILWKSGETAEPVLSLAEIRLRGGHNVENILALVTVAKILAIPDDAIRKTLALFVPLHHRIEYVASIKGVEFYDDSKGTNPGSVIAALESFEKPIVLIAGGKDKDMDFSLLAAVIAKKVKKLVVIGETALKIAEAARSRGLTEIHHAGTFDEALHHAFQSAAPGDVVLLSPACASFDMFTSAENRGDIFKRIVHEMEGENR